MKTNKKTVAIPLTTAQGGKATRITPLQNLKRSVMSCMLFEDIYYEDGVSVADRIKELVSKVKHEDAVKVAISARNDMHLRHAPLWIARWLAQYPEAKVSELLPQIIQRADELAEFVAMYWKEKKQPLSKQVKKGLAKAFQNFNEYQLAKYNRDGEIKLRDVLFLCHAKPIDQAQADLWKKLVDKTLQTPDTWETNLSAGADKKETFTRLIEEKKLGGMALLRNLRNMEQSKVDSKLIKEAIVNMKTDRILPFRFITAAKYAPKFEPELEQAMFKCLEGQPKLSGKTILVVDTSGSMYGGNLSAKSELTRDDAAAALAMLVREIAEEPRIYATAGNDCDHIHATKLLPPRKGFALRDLICNRSLMQEIGGGGIFITQCIDYIKKQEEDADRIIIITDEQDCDFNTGAHASDKTKPFGKHNYIINVSVERNGVGYGPKWVHIDGFSEKVIDFIQEYEKEEAEIESQQSVV